MTDIYIYNGPIFISGRPTRKCATAIQFSGTATALNSRENSTKRWPFLKK